MTNIDQEATIPCVVDEFTGHLKLYSDGSISRTTTGQGSIFDDQFHVHDDGSVLWKDVVYDQSNLLHLRMYKPVSTKAKKLPVLYYIHGGGFCLFSRDRPKYQNYCFKLARELEAVVLSLDYRLAPENRLPAAMEDGFTAVEWLRSQAVLGDMADAWLVECGDFSRVFICGESSGGTIAHNIAVRVGASEMGLDPVRVRGYVLIEPFFGGIQLTESEADQGPKYLPLTWEILDRFWRLSLPIGESRDYPLVNPFGPASLNLEPVKLDPIIVICGGLDRLKDRAKDYAERLQKLQKNIEYIEFEGERHGFYGNNPNSQAANDLMQIIKQFMAKYSG